MISNSNKDESTVMKFKNTEEDTMFEMNFNNSCNAENFDDDYEEDVYDYDDYDSGYEWTDEDAWDAMTDGMYGDYPGPGWDPEMFGY